MVVRISIRSQVGARLSAAALAAATTATAIALVSLSSSADAVPSSVTPSMGAGTVTQAVPATGSGLAHVVSAAAASLHPQGVEPTVTIAGSLKLRTAAERRRKISIRSSKGSHTWTASSLAEHDLPSAAMRAYRTAARSINATQAGCRLPWTLLAGIGRVESDHGRYGASVLGADGVSRPAIVGIPLDGVGPVAAIHDTDRGRFDGDTVWDRAVGPMQFIPSTWRTAGRDGDGDGVESPNDIDDAARAAAAYLCHGGRDLATVADERAAIFSYNPSTYYVDLVSAFARGYRTGTFVIPSPTVAPGSGDGVVRVQHSHSSAATAKARTAKAKAARAQSRAEKSRKARAAKARAARAKAAKHKPAHAGKPHSGKPPKAPRPSGPTPSRTVVTVVTGRLAAPRADTWTVGGSTVFTTAQTAGLGPVDLDGDGAVESVAAELTGVVHGDGSVRVTIRRTGSRLVVGAITVTAMASPPSATPTITPSGAGIAAPAG